MEARHEEDNLQTG